jgi:flagellar hook-associated protein 3 FlgL
MVMRITDGIRYQTTLANIRAARNGTGDVTEQLATGKRINHPSDDPAGAGNLIKWVAARSEIARYQSQISSTDLWLRTTDLILGRVKDLVGQAAGLASGNVSSDAGSRGSAIEVLQTVKDELLGLANETCGDRYLFAGTQADEAAFSVVTDAAGSESIHYNGNAEALSVAIGRQSTLGYSTTGSQVFYQNGQSVFEVLASLKSALESGDGAAISQAATALTAFQTQVLDAQSVNGVRQDRLDTAGSCLADLDAKLSDLVDNTETADTAELAVQFSQQEVALEASYSLASRVGGLSILDFLK